MTKIETNGKVGIIEAWGNDGKRVVFVEKDFDERRAKGNGERFSDASPVRLGRRKADGNRSSFPQAVLEKEDGSFGIGRGTVVERKRLNSAKERISILSLSKVGRESKRAGFSDDFRSTGEQECATAQLARRPKVGRKFLKVRGGISFLLGFERKRRNDGRISLRKI